MSSFTRPHGSTLEVHNLAYYYGLSSKPTKVIILDVW